MKEKIVRVKAWTTDDVAGFLKERGYAPSKDNIQKVLAVSDNLSGLAETTEDEREVIYQAIYDAREKLSPVMNIGKACSSLLSKHYDVTTWVLDADSVLKELLDLYTVIEIAECMKTFALAHPTDIRIRDKNRKWAVNDTAYNCADEDTDPTQYGSHIGLVDILMDTFLKYLEERSTEKSLLQRVQAAAEAKKARNEKEAAEREAARAALLQPDSHISDRIRALLEVANAAIGADLFPESASLNRYGYSGKMFTINQSVGFVGYPPKLYEKTSTAPDGVEPALYVGIVHRVYSDHYTVDWCFCTNGDEAFTVRGNPNKTQAYDQKGTPTVIETTLFVNTFDSFETSFYSMVKKFLERNGVEVKDNGKETLLQAIEAAKENIRQELAEKKARAKQEAEERALRKQKEEQELQESIQNDLHTFSGRCEPYPAKVRDILAAAAAISESCLAPWPTTFSKYGYSERVMADKAACGLILGTHGIKYVGLRLKNRTVRCDGESFTSIATFDFTPTPSVPTEAEFMYFARSFEAFEKAFWQWVNDILGKEADNEE